jgi:hypothetical protein
VRVLQQRKTVAGHGSADPLRADERAVAVFVVKPESILTSTAGAGAMMTTQRTLGQFDAERTQNLRPTASCRVSDNVLIERPTFTPPRSS